MRLTRHPRYAWRPAVRFSDAPTAAIAAVATQSVPTIGVDQLEREIEREFGRDRDADRERAARRERGSDRERELVPAVPNDRLVPADFSQEVALTSPIRLPRPRT